MQSPLLAAGSPQQQGSLLLQPQSPESADSSGVHQAEDAEPLKKGADVPLFGRSGYAPLSKEQPLGSRVSSLPPPAQRWSCGQQRLQLRDSFNSLEISALQILKHYDLDNNGFLDIKELRPLLKDHSDRDKVTDDELAYFMLVADKNNDENIDQQELFFGLRAWHAWNNMPKSVGAAFTRYNIGQGLAMPSKEKLKEAMLTLNESQPIEQDEAEYVHSLAISLGARAERATTDQMRKAIAAWYLNVERSDTNTTDIAMASLKETSKKLNVTVGNLKEQAAGITSKFSKGNSDRSSSIVDQAALDAGVASTNTAGGWTNAEDIPNTPADLRKMLQDSPPWALIIVAVVLLFTLVPYVILVFVMWYKVATLERKHTCQSNLRFPLGIWVMTELSSWAFAVYCACKDKNEEIKKCSACVLMLARVCILITGIIATQAAHREDCNHALYDTSQFLFVYVPLFVLALFCCTPLVAGCWFLLPSLKSAKSAEDELAGMNA
jgi:hypothetical protein